MTVYVGPTNWWWVSSPNATINCHVKGVLNTVGVGGSLRDGSRIICASAGTAIIVAPSSTEIGSQWAGGQYNSTLCGDRCCISEWPALNTRLINCGFTPTDWYVPSVSVLQNPGWQCRSRWDACSGSSNYWSSTEGGSTSACFVNFSNGGSSSLGKTNVYCVRAFRTVTY